jgi:exosortase
MISLSYLRQRDRWVLIAVTALLVALGVAVTYDAWADIATIATRDEESSHIFLVPIVCAWMAWVRRGRIRQCRPVGRWFGPLIVAFGWLLWHLGFNFHTQTFWHGGSILIAVGCVVTVTGIDLVRRFFPAFAVLMFLIPVPGMVRQQIAIPLQNATAQFTRGMLETFGWPTELSGNVLRINGVEVGIAEACNGLRMVFALVLVSYAFAYGTPLRHYVRLIVVAASPVSAIACNVIRLMPTVLLYGYAPKEVADKFHDASGWIMIIVAFGLLMGVIRLLRWALVPVTPYTLAYD